MTRSTGISWHDEELNKFFCGWILAEMDDSRVFSLFVSLFSFQQLHSCMKFGRTRDDICTAKHIYFSNSVKTLGRNGLLLCAELLLQCQICVSVGCKFYFIWVHEFEWFVDGLFDISNQSRGELLCYNIEYMAVEIQTSYIELLIR